MTNDVLARLLIPSNYGCWIDDSHQSGMQLDSDIIFFASGFGYDTNMEQIQYDLMHYDDLPLEEQADIAEALREDSMLALDWLNSKTSEIDSRYVWYIDDNCLYLDFDDAEGTEFNV